MDRDREAAAWDTGGTAPFLTIREVSVWALGEQHFRIESASGGEEVTGLAAARNRARELAGET